MDTYVYVKSERLGPFIISGRRGNTLVEARGQITGVPARDWAHFEQSWFGAAILAEGNVHLVERPGDDESADDDERSI
jgi:hypothetical protein